MTLLIRTEWAGPPTTSVRALWALHVASAASFDGLNCLKNDVRYLFRKRPSEDFAGLFQFKVPGMAKCRGPEGRRETAIVDAKHCPQSDSWMMVYQ